MYRCANRDSYGNLQMVCLYISIAICCWLLVYVTCHCMNFYVYIMCVPCLKMRIYYMYGSINAIMYVQLIQLHLLSYNCKDLLFIYV